MLANVQRQEVHLVVNPSKGLIKGWTDVYAAQPIEGQTSIGLHTLGHTITQVKINDIIAEFTLTPPPQPELNDVQPATTVVNIAEQAYYNYLSVVAHELQPDLVIQLPAGWDEKLRQQLQQQQQAGLQGAPAAAADGAVEGAVVEPVGQLQLVDAMAGGGETSQPPGTPTQPATSQGKAAPAAAPAPPPAPPIHIHVKFSKHLDAAVSSAAMFVPGHDSCDSCEAVQPETARNRYLIADPQLRRARALFPCADVAGAMATYAVHVTVPPDHVAVCDGVMKRCMMSHVMREDGQQVPYSRTYEFESEVPVNVSQVLLATGPLVVVPVVGGKASGATAAPGKAGAKQQQLLQEGALSCSITSFGPQGTEALVAYTSRPLELILKSYEKHLGRPIPFRQLYVVFLPAVGFRARNPPVVVGSNIILASTSLLVGPEALEDTVTTTLTLAHAVARCLFGGLLLPVSYEDAWVLDGLAAHMGEVWLSSWLGKNELAWRRHKERQALAQADNGGVPPLCARSRAVVAGAAVQLPAVYGSPLGTELLELGPLRRWRAAAVIRMFEKRAGEDQFKRTLGSLVTRARNTATSVKWRNIATDKFLKYMQKQSGIKGIEAFAQRWIYGRGCPQFELGMVYRKNNTVDLALRQAGSAACRKAALLAAKAAKQAGAEDDAQGQIKVVIHEVDASSEVIIKLSPGDTLVLHAGHDLVTKPAGKKPGARKTKGQKDEPKEVKEEVPAEEGAAEGAQGPRQPLLYARLDPGADWLCSARVYQPEASWVAQLEKSRDVVAQSLAVAGLAGLAGASGQGAAAAVGALSACLRNPSVYCRVRAEAALALGLVAGAELALPVLCGYLHEALYDPVTLSLKPNCFADLSEHVVLSALPIAIGLLRSDEDKSPPEAMDAVLDFLDNCDNTGNTYSDAGLVSCFLEAVGHMQPSTPQQLARLLHALDRWLALEDLSPSPQYVIGCACLMALHRLAYRLFNESARETRENVRVTLRTYASPGVPLPLRHAAANALMAHVVACRSEDKGTALLSCLLELRAAGGWGASGRAALVASAFNIMGELLSEKCLKPGADADLVADMESETAVTVDLAVQLYRCMRDVPDAFERQYIFMLLQRVAKQDPTLYRERDDEPADTAGPSQPEGTVRSGGMAVTGGRALPAVSGATTATLAAGGGTAAAARAERAASTKFRVKVHGAALMAAGMGPTASGGTIGAVTSGGVGGPGSPTRSHLTSRAPTPTPLGGTATSAPMPTASTGTRAVTEGAGTKSEAASGRAGTGAPAASGARGAMSGMSGGVGRGVADDEVMQPVRAAAVGVVGAVGVPGSPPRDPRTRGGAPSAVTTPAAPTLSAGRSGAAAAGAAGAHTPQSALPPDRGLAGTAAGTPSMATPTAPPTASTSQRKQRPAGGEPRASTATPPPPDVALPSKPSLPVSAVRAEAPSQAPSRLSNQAPSPLPSRAPSPMPSRAPSPLPSRAPSPLPSQARSQDRVSPEPRPQGPPHRQIGRDKTPVAAGVAAPVAVAAVAASATATTTTTSVMASEGTTTHITSATQVTSVQASAAAPVPAARPARVMGAGSRGPRGRSPSPPVALTQLAAAAPAASGGGGAVAAAPVAAAAAAGPAAAAPAAALPGVAVGAQVAPAAPAPATGGTRVKLSFKGRSLAAPPLAAAAAAAPAAAAAAAAPPAAVAPATAAAATSQPAPARANPAPARPAPVAPANIAPAAAPPAAAGPAGIVPAAAGPAGAAPGAAAALARTGGMKFKIKVPTGGAAATAAPALPSPSTQAPPAAPPGARTSDGGGEGGAPPRKKPRKT